MIVRLGSGMRGRELSGRNNGVCRGMEEGGLVERGVVVVSIVATKGGTTMVCWWTDDVGRGDVA